VLTRIELFLAYVASQCLPGAEGSPPTVFDYTFAGTLFVLVLYAAYRLLHGLFRPDTPARQALKTSILRD
jgi:hypothetical protein